MSRIYDALRRADLERQMPDEQSSPTASVSDAPKLVSTAPSITELLDVESVKRSWAPRLEAMPALRERDEVVEQFRGLRSHLAQARQEAPLKTVLVSSGMPSEGKSFVALNLAVSLARGNRNRVLLIDGDLRRPTLHTHLGTQNEPGLADYLEGTADLSAVLQRNSLKDSGQADLAALANLAFIASGPCVNDSSDLITNSRLEDLVSSLTQHFDWIVIDSPPILAFPDAVDFSRIADGVLLVAREAKTPYQVIQRAVAAFRQARILGVVLNAAKAANLNKYYYTSYYGSYYGATGPEQVSGPNKTVRSKA